MGDGACCHYCRRYECACHRLPGGDRGTLDEYLDSWYALLNALEDRFGMKALAYDPGIQVEFVGGTITLTVAQARALLAGGK